MIALNTLQNPPGSKKPRIRTGRGIGSGKGKTGGVGGKGQLGRAGIKGVRGVARGQTSYIKRLPKRGFKSLNPHKYNIINIQDLENLILRGKLLKDQVINTSYLIEQNLLQNDKLPVKLLGTGKLSIPLTFALSYYSESAKNAIINIGGQIEGFNNR